jgi:uncharacterized surface anchored protein
MGKTVSSPPALLDGQKHKNKKRKFRVAVRLMLVSVLALGVAISFLGQSTQAYAGTTGTDGNYYRLYDSERPHSNISHLRVDGNSAFCVEIDSEFSSGVYVSRRDAAEIYGQATVTRFSLYRDYVYSISWLSDEQRYFITQTLVWEALNPGVYPGGLRVEIGVSDQNQTNIKAEAVAYYNRYKDSYVGKGIYWDADTAQDLAEFWVERHTTGSIKLKKESANPTATDSNPRYSLAGAIYTIYNTDNAAVGTLTLDANGESNTVSNLWAGEFGTYYVKETKAPVGYERNTTTYTVNLNADGQVITVRATDEPILGRIELQKASSNPSVTDNNACYRLNGAEYGVYRSEAAAKSQSGRYATITTNNAGTGAVGNLPLGEYWVREHKAPEGYAVDPTIHYVDITTGKTIVQVSSKDTPKSDPIGILLNKADADTGLPYAGSDSATLAGAQFTVRYYDAQHKTVADAQADTPTRTWVIRTDDEGYALLDDEYLVGGDALYKNSAGDATIPIGTFTVQETKAPQGYLLFVPILPNAIRLFHITDDGSDGEFLSVYNALEVREQIIRGDIEVVKYQEDEVAAPDMPSEQKTPEVGATFDLYASRDFTGTTPSDGAKPALSIVTDEDGVASTIATGQVLLQQPDGSYTTRPRTPNDSGCLPFDTYLVVQRDAPFGYSPANRFIVTVDKDKASRTYIVGNVLIASAIRVEKRDSETGVVVPYPATWQILNAQTGEPVTMMIHYPATQVLDSFTSNNEGWLLLPGMLPAGSYLLHEVEPPNNGRIGYLLNAEGIPFEVTGYSSWDEPLVITCNDTPAKAQITLTKTDESNGEAVAGATYTVYAAEDVSTLDGTLRYKAGEQVDEFVTGADGSATSNELYLGSYVVQEIATVDGFALNPAAYPVELVYKSQAATVNIERVDVTDKPTTLRVLKVDAATGDPLSGVTFAFEDADGEVTEMTSGKDGQCTYRYLPQGSYRIYEAATIPGYVLSEEVLEVTVDSDGLINGQDTFELIFTNDFTVLEIDKTDIATGELVIGAVLQIFPIDGEGNIAEEPLYEWTTTEEPYLIARIPQGDYVLRELTAPAGYLVAQDVSFTVGDTGVIQRVEMQDDFTKVEITKADIATGEPLIGATLQVFPVDEEGNIAEQPLHEWVTSEEPYCVERMPQGSYILREVTAPVGYVVARDVAFTVTGTGEIQKVEMQDDFTRLSIIKVDADTGEPLAGATLQLIDKDGNPYVEWVSTTEPYLIERIPQGDYTLHEVSVPDGYELAADVKVTVKDTADTQTVMMADEPKPEPEKLDQTGRDGSLPFAAIGILAFVVLGGILFAVRQLRKKKDTPDDGGEE